MFTINIITRKYCSFRANLTVKVHGRLAWWETLLHDGIMSTQTSRAVPR